MIHTTLWTPQTHPLWWDVGNVGASEFATSFTWFVPRAEAECHPAHTRKAVLVVKDVSHPPQEGSGLAVPTDVNFSDSGRVSSACHMPALLTEPDAHTFTESLQHFCRFHVVNIPVNRGKGSKLKTRSSGCVLLGPQISYGHLYFSDRSGKLKVMKLNTL